MVIKQIIIVEKKKTKGRDWKMAKTNNKKIVYIFLSKKYELRLCITNTLIFLVAFVVLIAF